MISGNSFSNSTKFTASVSIGGQPCTVSCLAHARLLHARCCSDWHANGDANQVHVASWLGQQSSADRHCGHAHLEHVELQLRPACHHYSGSQHWPCDCWCALVFICKCFNSALIKVVIWCGFLAIHLVPAPRRSKSAHLLQPRPALRTLSATTRPSDASSLPAAVAISSLLCVCRFLVYCLIVCACR